MKMRCALPWKPKKAIINRAKAKAKSTKTLVCKPSRDAENNDVLYLSKQEYPQLIDWLNLDDDSALVSGQIKQGDQIVALGAHLLHEGERVRVSAPLTAATVEGARP